MATDQSGETDGVVIELRGELSKRDLHQVIDSLGTGDIREFHVEVTPTEGTEQPLPWLGRVGSDPGPERTGQADSATVGAQSSAETAGERNHPGTEEVSDPGGASDSGATDGDPEPSPTLQADSGAHRVATFLAERDAWLRAKEIRESIPDDWGLSPETVGSTLWRLADRNLVEKRPYEADRRQTEYRITDLGRETVERVDADPPGEAPADDQQVLEAE